MMFRVIVASMDQEDLMHPCTPSLNRCGVHFFMLTIMIRAGVDAARSFGTGCFKEHRTHDLRGLSESEIRVSAHHSPPLPQKPFLRGEKHIIGHLCICFGFLSLFFTERRTLETVLPRPQVVLQSWPSESQAYRSDEPVAGALRSEKGRGAKGTLGPTRSCCRTREAA